MCYHLCRESIPGVPYRSTRMRKHGKGFDEAGQVSLANLVAVGTAAKNLVLLGDQMQLGQPIQGVHPGRSGESALDYLLDGLATIPPDRGIFLPTSFRMHADVCRFISEAVYDGRLQPEAANQRQTLLLGSGAH